MATRLESGQVSLRGAGGVPMQQIVPQQVDYMVAAREEARGATTMAEILDRMGRSINLQAREMRQDEALRFAAENPLTPEQLQLAKEGLPQAIPGLGQISSDISYFGQALKKARSLELSSHFEIEGRNELTKMLSDVQNGKGNSQEIATKIATVTEGYAKSLAAVDPDAAIKFRATMATHGNTVLGAAYEAEVKRAKAERITKFDMYFDQGVQLLEASVTQQPEMIDELADVFRTNVANQSLLLGDPALQKEYSTKFETALRSAKIQALTKEVTKPEYLVSQQATLAKIRAGDVGKMSPVLQKMIATDFDAVAKVTANFLIAYNQNENAKKEVAAQQKADAVKAFIPLYEQAISLPEGDKRRRQLAGQIADIAKANPDAVPLGVLKDLLEPAKAGEGNAMVEFNVLQGIYEGRITSPDQIFAMTKRGLSAKQAVSALKLLNREDRQDQNELDRGISQRAGIPVVPGSVVVLDPKGAEFKRRQELSALAKDIEARLIREGKVPTPRMILSEIDDGIAKQRNSEGAKAARKQLEETWSKRPWINGPITRGNLPALKEKAKKENKMNEYNQIEKLLNQAEGQ